MDEKIDAERARTMLAHGEARAIEVGDPEVAAKARIPGAVVVGDRDLREAAEAAVTEKRDALLVFGENDEQAAKAAGELREHGLDAASVEGGFEAWTSAGGQVQPRADEEYDGPDLKQPGA
jgi:rhodanese-related sulfurtransferase